MRVVPAIDLKDGQCVRLRQGHIGTATVYAEDPEALAREFVAKGARWIHVVDLDGAFEGAPRNADAIRAIARSGAHIIVGGGLRDLPTIEETLEEGAERIVLGTVAVRDPALLEKACQRFPGRILVAVDAREGEVAINGWVHRTGQTVTAVARRAKATGAAGLLYTDILRDGTREGVNVAGTAGLAQEVGLPVIASGGVSSLVDLEALGASPGVEAAVVGSAVYEGALDLEEACHRWNASTLLPD